MFVNITSPYHFQFYTSNNITEVTGYSDIGYQRKTYIELTICAPAKLLLANVYFNIFMIHVAGYHICRFFKISTLLFYILFKLFTILILILILFIYFCSRLFKFCKEIIVYNMNREILKCVLYSKICCYMMMSKVIVEYTGYVVGYVKGKLWGKTILLYLLTLHCFHCCLIYINLFELYLHTVFILLSIKLNCFCNGSLYYYISSSKLSYIEGRGITCHVLTGRLPTINFTQMSKLRVNYTVYKYNIIVYNIDLWDQTTLLYFLIILYSYLTFFYCNLIFYRDIRLLVPKLRVLLCL